MLEISVLMAQFPSPTIARKSYDYRTLGLGFANLGTLLMLMGIPYDSGAGRSIAGALAAILTGVGYTTSAEMAAELGPFRAFPENRDDMLRVIRNHRRAAHGAPEEEYEGLSVTPQGLDEHACPASLLKEAQAIENAIEQVLQEDYRTYDIMSEGKTKVGTKEMGDLIARKVEG